MYDGHLNYGPFFPDEIIEEDNVSGTFRHTTAVHYIHMLYRGTLE